MNPLPLTPHAQNVQSYNEFSSAFIYTVYTYDIIMISLSLYVRISPAAWCTMFLLYISSVVWSGGA